ncbi:MAG TPA: two-component regulator propeller domain-containing protein, partial [Flavisolibacter sp.]|nr:two-component regulator propeller domain-containing protein [Flavisolibacter sp.]
STYLSTGLGVIVVDAEKYEISDSWIIGENGGPVKTNMFTKANGNYYAATEEGLKTTPVGRSNPANFSSWVNLSGANGLQASAAKAVLNYNNTIVVLQNDTIFIKYSQGFQPFFANGWPVTSVNVSMNKLLVSEHKPTGEARVIVLDVNGNILSELKQENVIAMPEKAIALNNEYWVADLYGGLSRWANASATEIYKLNSPDNIALGQLVVDNNTFYAAAGAVNDSWNYQYNPNGIYQLKDGYWTSFNRYHNPSLDPVLDIISIAPDGRDGTLWGGSFGGGLVHLGADNSVKIFKQDSPLEAIPGDPGSYRVSGLAFDQEHNLWISNFGASHPLHVLKNDGSWQSYTIPVNLNLNAVGRIIIDDASQKWIQAPLGNGLLVFNDNGTIDNTSDDKWKLYTGSRGAGNLPSNDVTALAKDKNGFIWVGTTNGIGVIQCPFDALTSGCEAIWPVIREGNFANYLFKGEVVKSIAVDGADRKWVATSSGAWLVNSEGDKVLIHFTQENSPLLSNNVIEIAIDGKTGEVYFATDKGICSYRSDATEAQADQGNVLVFPNPVPPGYNGPIAIKGLPENSIAKITELNGRLVYQVRSLGGQAIWNGRDYKGRKVASGIYIVIASDEQQQQKAVTKIVFISND